MEKLNKTILTILALFALMSTFQAKGFAQEREDDPRTWKYFRILANARDDSIFIKLQDDLLIDPKFESFILVVNIQDNNPINQYVVLGDEASPDAQRFAWSQLTPPVQQGLINWAGSNKENLNQRKLNYASVFTDVIRQIKIKEVVAPPRTQRQIRSTTHYINPYFQFFGGEPVGIPIKRSIGISFHLGTPYTGPFETDMVGAGFHILGATFAVNGRIRELIKNDSLQNQGNAVSIAAYNNVWAAPLSMEVRYVIPFGNFFEFGYMSVTGDKTDPSRSTGGPVPRILKTSALPDTVYMPSNVQAGNYFNWEARYPFTAFGSTRAKFYVARYMDETNIGFIGREMRLAGSVFDFRVNYLLKGKRNPQLLLETMIQNIGEGFGLTSFGIGPSLRLSTKPDGKFGAVTIMFNARVKLGDYFEEQF